LSTFRKPLNKREPLKQTTPDEHRINNRILAREVRLIADDGEQLGVLLTKQAQEIAESRGLDLVEVSPNSKPPVCRLMDYGKYKYKEQKKESEAKKKRTENITKELRLRYRTDVGDLETKLRHAREFLLEGDKVKFSMKFKGREVAYSSLGAEKFEKIASGLADISVVEEKSPLGRQMHIVLAPSKEVLLKAQQVKKQKEMLALKNAEKHPILKAAPSPSSGNTPLENIAQISNKES
jgi:translation initiation factor IF-3